MSGVKERKRGFKGWGLWGSGVARTQLMPGHSVGTLYVCE